MLWSIALSLLAGAPPPSEFWKLETQPLTEAGCTPLQFRTLRSTSVGVLARCPGRDEPFEVRVVTPGAPDRLVERFKDQVSLVDGTGLVVQHGRELLRLRGDSLESIGDFGDSADSVSCAELADRCVALTGQRQLELLEGGACRPLEVEGLTAEAISISLDGRWLAAQGGGDIHLIDLGSVKARAVKAHAVLAGAEAYECSANAVEWSERGLLVELGPVEGIGSPECPSRAPRFVLDPVTGRRHPAPLPPLGWRVLGCPRGGWQMDSGAAVVTECAAPSLLPPKQGRAEDESPPLSEALALSPRDVLVFAPRQHHAYQWYARFPGGRPLDFALDGPSVISFAATGVKVQPIDWSAENSVVSADLGDDWHLVESAGESPALMRLTRDD